MATKERNQNPLCNDTVILRLFEFNQNSPANVTVNQVEIYFLDPTNRHHDNPDGRRLLQTFTEVNTDDTGQYSVDLTLTSPLFVIGEYIDVWYITFESDECPGTRTFQFKVGPDKWYANPEPFLWEFAFAFRPNKFRKNERKNIVVEVTPNVPHISDLERYYADLASFPSLFVTIEMRCGECVPRERDLRLVVERQPVTMTNSRLGCYFLDTTELDCGMYDIWFELDLGGNTYISPVNQIQIF